MASSTSDVSLSNLPSLPPCQFAAAALLVSGGAIDRSRVSCVAIAVAGQGQESGGAALGNVLSNLTLCVLGCAGLAKAALRCGFGCTCPLLACRTGPCSCWT